MLETLQFSERRFPCRIPQPRGRSNSGTGLRYSGIFGLRTLLRRRDQLEIRRSGPTYHGQMRRPSPRFPGAHHGQMRPSPPFRLLPVDDPQPRLGSVWHQRTAIQNPIVVLAIKNPVHPVPEGVAVGLTTFVREHNLEVLNPEASLPSEHLRSSPHATQSARASVRVVPSTPAPATVRSAS